MTADRTAAARNADRAGPQSVGRIFAVLDRLAATPSGATLSELATAARAPKTSLVGLLAGLIAEGCLRRDDARRYLIGPRVQGLAVQVLAGRELVLLARPALADLAAKTGETAVLGALATDADLAVYLDKVESTNPIRYAVSIGERRELYCTAMGKMLLAHFDAERRRRYLRTSVRKRWTSTTIVETDKLEVELERIRRDGLARTEEERFVGASGIAAPIFDRDGVLAGAIALAGPTARMRLGARRNEAELRHAAVEISRLTRA